MLEKYCVYYDGKEIGMVEIKNEGLYLVFCGKMQLEQNKIWRIIATSGEGEIDLGICLFEDPYYTLYKKLPRKKLLGDQWSFKAICPNDKHHQAVPVSENCPFEALDRIIDGKYTVEDESEIIFDGDHEL